MQLSLKPKNPSLREYQNRDQKYEKFRGMRKSLSKSVKESAEFWDPFSIYKAWNA